MESKASGHLSGSPVRLREPSPKHPPTLPDGNSSVGSAAVGAACSNVPLLRLGLVLERECYFVAYFRLVRPVLAQAWFPLTPRAARSPTRVGRSAPTAVRSFNRAARSAPRAAVSLARIVRSRNDLRGNRLASNFQATPCTKLLAV